MSSRHEVVVPSLAPGANVRALCRQHNISPKTLYKWQARYKAGGFAALADLSRRPKRSPTRTDPTLEQAIVALRTRHHAWGSRKLRKVLLNRGHPHLPAISTITGILHRHDLISPEESAKHAPHQRIEHPQPNDLWQMDFKGHFPLTTSGRCHPLTALDDHSRFCLTLHACTHERTEGVQTQLIHLFRTYGMPARILCDNGPPWGAAGGEHTLLSAWLLRLGIAVSHGRPHHPQTQGKEERFHRTLKAEVIAGRSFADAPEAQRAFDVWREVYNLERPHEALAMAVPASRYQPSKRAYPESLPTIEYGPADQVRKVCREGWVLYRSRYYKVGRAFARQEVAIRPTARDGVLDVYYCHAKVATLDLTQQNPSKDP